MDSLPPYTVHWHPAGETTPVSRDVYTDSYPVRLIDGSVLELPIRPLPGGRQAIALLMSNQTPFTVEDAMAPMLASVARDFDAQGVVAVPTMGLDYGRVIARALGHADMVALGLSRKFWYDDRLSEPVSSSTSPTHQKSLYLDPALVPRVAGRRVVLVDDVINTGTSARSAIRLLQRAGARVQGIVVVLTEGYAWREALEAVGPEWAGRVRGVGHIPLFEACAGGWRVVPGTD